MSAVAKHEPEERAPALVQTEPNPIMAMIAQAVQSGQPIEVIRELKDMAKELAADEAQRAFNSAFADFKSEVIEVRRNRSVNDGPLKGRKYAELISFVEAATPALSKHGLSASWSITRDEKDWIEVTCTIEHAKGGKKHVALGGPPDAGGAKNTLQARISTVTYLERATFKAACGLAEQGDDDDGSGGAGPAAISGEQVEELMGLIDRAVEADPNTSRADWLQSFLDFMKVESLQTIPAKDFNKAKSAINDAIRQRTK